MRKKNGLVLEPKVSPGYTKARAKIEQRINAVIAELFNKHGFSEFTYSSIELSKKCGTRDYATQYRDKLIAQTYRGNSISKKMSTYRIRQENFTPEILEVAKDLAKNVEVELREKPDKFDQIRFVTFNLINIEKAKLDDKFSQSDKFQLRQLDRALRTYGEIEDPNNAHLVTLAIPHNQIGCRLYATWPFCLQCSSSDLRDASISGDSIDLDAAAVQCMMSLGTKYEGNPAEIEVLDFYIKNKRTLRQDLSQKFDVPEDTIKCIFNIMVLGGHGSAAQVAANYRDTNSIARIVGDSLKAATIVSDPFIKSFYLAVKSLRRLIVESMHVEIDNGWEITNAAGVVRQWFKKPNMRRNVKPVPRMMNWIYQGYELSTMEENVDSIGNRNLPMHDSREGISAIEAACDSFDKNSVKYTIKSNNKARVMFPELV